MFTLIILALVVIAILLAAIWLSPSFKELVVTKWGVAGSILLAAAAWVASWFAGAPPTIPPM